MRNFLMIIAAIIGIGLLASWIKPGSSMAGIMNDQSGHPELEMVTYERTVKKVPDKFNGKERKVVYLTIDDGPSLYTKELIEVLNQYNIPATHFLIGNNMKKYPDMTKEYVNRGDYIGMHSMSHNYNRLYKKGRIVEEIIETQKLIKEQVGILPTLFRCPYGSSPGLNEHLRDQVTQAGLKTWDWTIDSKDWQLQNNPSKIKGEILAQLNGPEEIILIHEKKNTIKVLPEIIESIQEAGYEFERYDESKHFPLNFHNDNRL